MTKSLETTSKVKRQRRKKLTPLEALNIAFQEYAPNTKRAYARVIKDFQAWAGLNQISDMENLDSLVILDYKNHLRDQGKKPASINQSMSALKKICKILTEFGYLKVNPLKSSVIRNEKVSTLSNKGALRLNQLNAMIKANRHMEYDERVEELLRSRNELILRFLYLTATRRSEVANLEWDHLQQSGPFYVARLPETKSGMPQQVKLRNELYSDLMSWKQELLLADIETNWVFPSLGHRTFGQKMTGKGINDVIVKLGKAIGLEISAHYLRHTAITLALELGESLQKVQSYARHASANTTIRYFHDQDSLKKNPTDSLPLI